MDGQVSIPVIIPPCIILRPGRFPNNQGLGGCHLIPAIVIISFYNFYNSCILKAASDIDTVNDL
jgi:hypothetical protein